MDLTVSSIRSCRPKSTKLSPKRNVNFAGSPTKNIGDKIYNFSWITGTILLCVMGLGAIVAGITRVAEEFGRYKERNQVKPQTEITVQPNDTIDAPQIDL